MHILVTGGAGFIGSHIVDLHMARGDHVHVIDDLSTGFRDNITRRHLGNPNFHFEEADILTWPELEKVVTWADRVYHMAAVVGVFRVLEDPIKVLAINISAVERLLRAANASKWNPKIMIASSSEIYGHGLRENVCINPGDGGGDVEPLTVEEFREDQDPRVGSSAVSRWNYSISKLTAEAFGLSYARMHAMDVTVVRLFNTIGPRQTGRYGMVVPRFVEQAVKGKPITVFGNGLQMRSFCDVRDTVAALDLLASVRESRGEIVNVGNDHEITIKELAESVREFSESASELKYISYKEAYGEEFEESYRRRPNLEKLYRLIGFRHKWTLEDTLRDLISIQRRAAPSEAEV